MELKNSQELKNIARALVAEGKGLLAMDESVPTCDKRLSEVGVTPTVETRRAYREMIVTTPGLGEFLNGAILFEETLPQSTKDGRPFLDLLRSAGVIPGIKVDEGTQDLPLHPEEKITRGLDDLRDRLQKFAEQGLRFAKWRGVFKIHEGLPSPAAIRANATTLALYASFCQEAGLVPIVEPEVLMDGAHSLERCFVVTEEVLQEVFRELGRQGVLLEGMLLKPNMILPGLEAARQNSVEEVAAATVTCLRRCVPVAVPGVAFLSGGQEAELATAHLNAMNAKWKAQAPWALTYSFARALQQPALEIWRGKDANVAAAQEELYHRGMCNSAARLGQYAPAMENRSFTPARAEFLI